MGASSFESESQSRVGPSLSPWLSSRRRAPPRIASTFCGEADESEYAMFARMMQLQAQAFAMTGARWLNANPNSDAGPD
jgi:hypothetical protein